MALADIAHIGDAALRDRRAEAALCDDLHRLGFHVGEQRVHRDNVEGGKALIKTANNLVADGRTEETDGAANAGARWHQHMPDADLLRDAARVHWAAAAERDQRAAFIGLAGLDRVDARGVGHVLVDHLDDAERGHLRGQPKLARRHARSARRGPPRHPACIVPPAKRAGS